MKKSTHKRLTAWLLTLALVVTLLPGMGMTALAAEDGGEGNGPPAVEVVESENGNSGSDETVGTPPSTEPESKEEDKTTEGEDGSSRSDYGIGDDTQPRGLKKAPPALTAAGTYPSANDVSVDGIKNFSEPGYYYFRNGESKCSNNSAGYNAYYDPTTGTLTLRDYNGAGIVAGGTLRTNITVVLIGENTINNGTLESSVGGDITVTSSRGGTLSITREISNENPAVAIQTGYASTTGSVTITGNAKVTGNVTHNGTRGYEKAYGIYAKENITISGEASVDIIGAAPYNNVYHAECCVGLRAIKDVVIDTTGRISIDMTRAGGESAGGERTQSYGIFPIGIATLTNVGEMEVKWKCSDNSNFPGGAVYGKESFDPDTHAVNVDTANCYASYRKGTPYTVTVKNGTLTGPGVEFAKGSGMFLKGDSVNIKPSTMTGKSGDTISFKEWTSSDVTITNPAVENNSFTVPDGNVTVTAKHNPFVVTPVFTSVSGTSGTLEFQTEAKPHDKTEYFQYVKVGEEDDIESYKYISRQPTTISTASPYQYSVSATNGNSGDIKFLKAGNYRMAVTLNGKMYSSDPFTVNYTAAPTDNYPDSVSLYNASGKSIDLGDGKCLAANDAGSAISYTSSSPYVARYDKSNGTLYLKDYHGTATGYGLGAERDLNIVVESNSSFTTSATTTYKLYGIQANGGKLNISGDGKLTVTANGNAYVYGIYASEGVTISAPIDVTVGENSATNTGTVYGIYTNSGAISLSGGDKTVTATGGRNDPAYGVYNNAKTSSTAAGNIDISGKLTVKLKDGDANCGISSNGGVITLYDAAVNIPSNFYFGIYNKNGNVVIENKSDVILTSDISNANGVYARYGGDLIIKNSIVKVSTVGSAAIVEKGKLYIKDSKVDLTRNDDRYRVVGTDDYAMNTIDLSGSGWVTLTALGEQTYAMIGGKVTATSGTKLEKGTHYPDLKNYDGEYDAASNKTVLKFVHDSAASMTNISADWWFDPMVFTSMEEGYVSATGLNLTITNKGAADTGELTITVEGKNPDAFTVSKEVINNIPVGGSAMSTVRPAKGLSADTYTATLKISGANVNTLSFNMKFTVKPKTNPGASATVSGTALSWNATDDALYYLYPSTTEDAAIRAQWKTGGTVSGYTHTGTKNAITATTVDGKAMQAQPFSFGTIPAGNYKLVIFKPGKYVPKIVPITVGTTDYDCGQLKLWLYGDVNYDGVVTGVDASQVLRYTKLAVSVFSSGTAQEKADRLEAANVTYPKNGDTEITGTDASQILRYTKLANSVFDYIP